MFKEHQDATLLPLNLESDHEYEFDDDTLKSLSASASKDADGVIHVSLANIHPEKAADITMEIRGQAVKEVTGRILTAPELNSHNTFEQPEQVKPGIFSDVKLKKQIITMELPPKSIVVLEIK
jgi:alpha-N-arabinofuranosidase